MRNNSQLQQDVQNAFKWEPSIRAAEIGVTAQGGVVTLSGKVDSYAKKLAAEEATKNVIGVRAIAEDINVDFSNSFIKDDSQVTEEVLGAWKSSWQVPSSKIKVKVENGWVNPEGQVPWNFQRDAAKNSIIHLDGVKVGINGLSLKSESKDTVEEDAITKALDRNWSINGHDIKVAVNHSDVKLTGKVKSIYQQEEAGRLAWNTPGVHSVDNELAVTY